MIWKAASATWYRNKGAFMLTLIGLAHRKESVCTHVSSNVCAEQVTNLVSGSQALDESKL